MKRIIINGANGYVASHFINELLINNYEVYALVRESKKYSAYNRMKDALTEINEGVDVMSENIRVYNYSLLHENFSIPENHLKDIFSQEVDYFHFAASLKYDLKSKNEIFKTNLDGLENSLKIFSKYASSTSRFFFISTAYSCGNFSGVFKETFYDNEDISSFRNYYEQSKRFAENIIKKQIKMTNLNAHILRLSQVVGNNKSGVTMTDYGIFDFAKRIHRLANRYPNNTVRVRVDPESTQNLIPIDNVINYLMRAVELQTLPVIMNFIAKNSIKNIHIINTLCKLLPITIIPEKYIEQANMDAFERMISMGMSFTGSYAGTNILFDTKHLNQVVLSGNNEPNEETINKMLKYFIDKLSEKKESTALVSTC